MPTKRGHAQEERLAWCPRGENNFMGRTQRTLHPTPGGGGGGLEDLFTAGPIIIIIVIILLIIIILPPRALARSF